MLNTLAQQEKQRIFASDSRIVFIRENLRIWPSPEKIHYRRFGGREVMVKPVPSVRLVTVARPWRVYFEEYPRWRGFSEIARWAAYSISGGILLSSRSDREKLRRVFDVIPG